MIVPFVAGALTVLISSACSLFEAVLYSVRMGAPEAERSQGKHSGLAGRMIRMKSNIAEPTSAILVLNTIANTAGATLCGMYATQVLGTGMVPVVSVVLTVAILFIGEILPKTYGATHWQRLWHLIVWPTAVLARGLAPLIKVTQAFARLFTGGRGMVSITEDELRASIRLSRVAGELSSAEQQLLQAVFRFDDMLVRQVMVPRTDVAILDASWSLERCREAVERTRRTRFPLCRASLDEVIGLIHVKHLVGQTDGADFDLRSLSRPLPHVPETLPLSRLIQDMQREHQQMVLVDDEYGSAVGIATMENLLEQIVGAVEDEFDSETPDIIVESPTTFLVRGQLPLERINRECDLDLYSPVVETLSGHLASLFGRILAVGDLVQLAGASGGVVQAEGGRANWVRLRIDITAGQATEADRTEGGFPDQSEGMVASDCTRR